MELISLSKLINIFLCYLDLHCYLKAIKNTPVSHTVAPRGMLHHYDEHGHLFILSQFHIHCPAVTYSH